MLTLLYFTVGILGWIIVERIYNKYHKFPKLDLPDDIKMFLIISNTFKEFNVNLATEFMMNENQNEILSEHKIQDNIETSYTNYNEFTNLLPGDNLDVFVRVDNKNMYTIMKRGI